MARLALALLLACACSSSTSGRTLDPAEGGAGGTEASGGSAGSEPTAGTGGDPHAGGSASGSAGALAGAGGSGGEAAGGTTGGTSSTGTGGDAGGSDTGGSAGAAGAGGTVDPLDPVAAPNCEGYFDWYVPEGTCIWVHGRFTTQNEACDVQGVLTQTCGTITAAVGAKSVRVSGTVGVVSPTDVEVTRFDLEDGSCSKACD